MSKSMEAMLNELKTRNVLPSRISPFYLQPRSPAGLLQPATITNLFQRPVLRNPDGSYSTTSSFSVGTDRGEVLIPSVINGKRLTEPEAIDYYMKTGQHLGVFDTPENANAYALALHNEQARIGAK